jgi:hypothetical protein
MSCGETLTGRYCSGCGERAVSKHDYSIHHFLELIAESLFHLDGRVLNTFRVLLQQPGVLARNFFEGPRKRYMGPVQCLIVYAMATWLWTVGVKLWVISGGPLNLDVLEWVVIVLIGVPFTIHLYFANRRFFNESRSVTWIKSILLMLSSLGIITVYRFILFFTTFYAT